MIRIYGASDDLVEVENDARPLRPGEPDEIGHFNRPTLLRVTPIDGAERGGLLVRMRYASFPGAVWSAELAQIDEDEPIPWPVTVRHGKPSRGYSVVVEIDDAGTAEVMEIEDLHG